MQVDEGDDLGRRGGRLRATASNARSAADRARSPASTRPTRGANLTIYQDIYQPLGNRQFDEAVRRPCTCRTRPPAPSRASAEINQAMLDGINRALSGSQSPRAALNQAQRRALAAYNRNG